MTESKIDMRGLTSVLKKFDEKDWRKTCTSGRWSICNGGYDLWFSIMFDGKAIIECVDGELSIVQDLSEAEEKKLLEKVHSIYEHTVIPERRYEIKFYEDVDACLEDATAVYEKKTITAKSLFFADKDAKRLAKELGCKFWMVARVR